MRITVVFPAALGPKQTQYLALFHREADVIDSPMTAIVFRQVLELRSFHWFTWANEQAKRFGSTFIIVSSGLGVFRDRL